MGKTLSESDENDPLLTHFARYLKLQLHRSPRTVAAYVDVAGRYLASYRFETGSIRMFLREAAPGLAPSSQAQWASAMKNFLNWILREKNHPIDPKLLKEISRPRVAKKLIQIIDEEDLPLLLKTLETRPLTEKLLFELLMGSGLRISEAQGLRWDQIDLIQSEARVLGKGAKIRRTPLTTQACLILHQLKPTRNSERPSIWPKQESVRTLRRWVENWGKFSLLNERTGNLHPHKLRHSLASHLLRRGARLPQIQKLLGHSHLSTTERYTHLNPEDMLRIYDLCFPKLQSAENPKKKKT